MIGLEPIFIYFQVVQIGLEPIQISPKVFKTFAATYYAIEPNLKKHVLLKSVETTNNKQQKINTCS